MIVGPYYMNPETLASLHREIAARRLRARFLRSIREMEMRTMTRTIPASLLFGSIKQVQE